ncbi:unnamed protein product [Sphenostylis stenocarpa]|uniref:Uncharacterized protein n=1 Tax=Sphenostylis stenocarpa TaxID=92480 RepID=A0AA86VY06_9FABA|nr:unnamed protein product [Sphenostylis stenocarpa]
MECEKPPSELPSVGMATSTTEHCSHLSKTSAHEISRNSVYCIYSRKSLSQVNHNIHMKQIRCKVKLEQYYLQYEIRNWKRSSVTMIQKHGPMFEKVGLSAPQKQTGSRKRNQKPVGVSLNPHCSENDKPN